MPDNGKRRPARPRIEVRQASASPEEAAAIARAKARGRGARAKLRAAARLEQLAERCQKVAGQIAERVDSAELYVTWTPAQGAAVPEVMAELRDAGPHWLDTLTLVFRAVREIWTVLLSREQERPAVTPAADGAPAEPKPAA
jgi:hypothetical protein